jgi:hypothetical protein
MILRNDAEKHDTCKVVYCKIWSIMKKISIFLFLLFISLTGSSQSCLPQGITFYTQAQIDNFQIDYPNCTQIEGGLTISGSLITNLDELSVIKYIGGTLSISNNLCLTSLNGLNNLDSIGGSLLIRSNPTLVNLTGLESLMLVGGSIRISKDSSLTNMAGLDNLTLIRQGLDILWNSNLSSLTGLENLTLIGGFVYISDNPTLQNINALGKLSYIGGYLTINDNNILTNLTGLEHLTEMGLSVHIYNSPALLSLTGLDSLTSIGGFVSIFNNASLNNLTGLGKLKSIGYYLAIDNNNAMTSLNGVDNLTNIYEIIIDGNPVLNSLIGLENINSDSLEKLIVRNNTSLSVCAVKSICDYMGSPNGTIEIHDNAVGCNSQAEVDTSCKHVSVENLTIDDGWLIYPNPASTTITIETSAISAQSQFSIMEVNGQQLITQQITESKTLIDISNLPSGVYFVRMTGDKSVAMGKFIKQ